MVFYHNDPFRLSYTICGTAPFCTIIPAFLSNTANAAFEYANTLTVSSTDQYARDSANAATILASGAFDKPI